MEVLVGGGGGVFVDAGMAVFVGAGKGFELGSGAGELQPKRTKPTAASATSTTSLILRIISSIKYTEKLECGLGAATYSITH